MTKPELKAKIKEVKAEIEDLAMAVNKKLKENTVASPFAEDTGTQPGCASAKLKAKRTLRGHFGKIDGNVIIWDCLEARKKFLMPLKSAWVMFAEASQDDKNMCASGGLDNVCTVWQLPTAADPAGKLLFSLEGHEGYGKDIDMRGFIFEGHDKDVTSCDFKPGAFKEFVTSSADGSMMTWAIGQKTPTSTMRLYQADLDAGMKRGQTKTLIDVNKVKYQSNGFGIGVATEAMGSFLYDVRTLGAANTFVGSSAESKSIPKYSCAFSKSGRLMFVGTEDNTIEVWDTFKPDAGSTLQSLTMNHDNRITESLGKDHRSMATWFASGQPVDDENGR
ncbi:hypothetical protein JL720_10884 [Aureococcus anophagefferens]|nr:hypothetical protein JL720_10884 [Aureococcus anophagefferens]